MILNVQNRQDLLSYLEILRNCMENTGFWLRFPSHIDLHARRSLSIAFILEELLKSKINLDCLDYYCEHLSKDSSLKNEIVKLKIERLEGKELFLHPFFFALLPHLFQSRTDENILLRLIENRELLNQKFGKNTVEKILLSFSPIGFTHVKTIISEGLLRRGFRSFLAEKEHLLDTFEVCTHTLV
jgi:hypothetical protein